MLHPVQIEVFVKAKQVPEILPKSIRLVELDCGMGFSPEVTILSRLNKPPRVVIFAVKISYPTLLIENHLSDLNKLCGPRPTFRILLL